MSGGKKKIGKNEEIIVVWLSLCRIKKKWKGKEKIVESKAAFLS